MWMADVLPHTAKMADDICLINSMWTDHPNHDNALYKIHSGRLFMGYPTLGAWTVYGLGSENQNLPAYVVLNDPLGQPKNGTRNWTAGFLPPVYQGTRFRPTGSPILNLKPQYEQPSPVTESARGLLNQLDEIHRTERPYYPELDARIESYSLAARMQLSAGEALDLSRESQQTLSMYGIGEKCDRLVWSTLFAGSPPGRTGCSIRADLSRRTTLGQPRRSGSESSWRLPADRQAGCRIAPRSETKRLARFDPCDLGR